MSKLRNLKHPPGAKQCLLTSPDLVICCYCLVAQSCPNLATPWTVARRAPLSMGFFRKEHWNGLPFPSPGDFPDPGIEPTSPALAGRFSTAEPPRKPKTSHKGGQIENAVSNLIRTATSFSLLLISWTCRLVLIFISGCLILLNFVVVIDIVLSFLHNRLPWALHFTLVSGTEKTHMRNKIQKPEF